MVIAKIGREQYKTEVTVTGHQLIADEPLEKGGQDLGPAPGQFLQVALACCTAITVRMYVDHKQWPVEKIEVEVDTEKANGKTIFKRQLSVTGNLTEEQRTRLLQVANACPVHKTLTQPIEVETFLE